MRLSDWYFYPRSPCGERQIPRRRTGHFLAISIHALLAESDWGPQWIECRHPPFLSTLSLRRATTNPRRRPRQLCNFYPRSPCGERPHANRYYVGLHLISIHALLAESDPRDCPAWSRPPYFYPRSPCGERPMDTASKKRYLRFLSTLSLRRATDSSYGALEGASISIHALLAESDSLTTYLDTSSTISIHALLAESDGLGFCHLRDDVSFLSTLSLRRATLQSV